MKLVAISDEYYDFLVNLSRELNTQDNRGTASPYFYQVKQKKKVPGPDGNGEREWLDPSGEPCDEDERSRAIADHQGWDDLPDHEINELLETLDDYYKESVLWKLGYSEYWYTWEDEWENAFLTEKACKEHIRLNHYHYNEPVDFLTHATRNPELEKLISFLKMFPGEVWKAWKGEKVEK